VARRLILDTNRLIESERTGTLPGVKPDDELFVAAISVAELEAGVLLARHPRHTERRRAHLDHVRATCGILVYTPTTASVHAELLAHTTRTGTPRGAHDLIIAAHARENDLEVMSGDDHARFGDLPGVRLAASRTHNDGTDGAGPP
jgi:predicted nucleic acid-binding protein